MPSHVQIDLRPSWRAFQSLLPAPSPMRWCGLATIALILLLGLAILLTNFTADVSLSVGLLKMLTIGIAAVFLRKLGCPRIATGIEAVMLLTVFSICAALMSFVMAARMAPLADPVLAAWDVVIFGDAAWPWLLAIGRTCPGIMRLLSVVYETLPVQPLILMPMLLIRDATDRLRRFLFAWMLTLAATVLIFAFAPAVAAYLYFGVTREMIPGLGMYVAWDHVETLFAVRNGGLRHLNADILAGIVTFPSFHAAGAVLLGWGFYGVTLIRWPMIAVNVALFLSAIFVGGHYLVDLVAGGAIAVGAIFLSRWVFRQDRVG